MDSQNLVPDVWFLELCESKHLVFYPLVMLYQSHLSKEMSPEALDNIESVL